MNKSIIILCLAFLLVLPNVSGNLGTFQKDTCIQIRVPVNSSITHANISTLTYPNGQIGYTNLSLSGLTENTFNITYCDTSQMGVYVFDYFTSQDSTTIPNQFEITADGQPYQNFPIVYLLTSLGLIFLVFGKYLGRNFQKDIFDTFSGVLFMIAGIMTMYPGFNYTDYSTLGGQALGVILLGLGMVITYYANKEVFE